MLADILHYKMPVQSNWQGRKDSLAQERYFKQVSLEDVRSYQHSAKTEVTFIVGFCSDEGIRRNEGRMGAKEGPEALRKQLGKLACHKPHTLIDLGDIVCDNGDLELAQAQFAKIISYCHQWPCKTLAFGGGHDIAWAHFLGLNNRYPKIGIINFDAHFDLRPCSKANYGTSGTSFWQIASYYQGIDKKLDYCCIGIQKEANTKSLFKEAQAINATYLTVDDMASMNFLEQYAVLDAFMKRNDVIYLTICMDVFAESYAPGVSAPLSLGLTPWQALPLLKYIMQSGKVVSCDIAELSPRLDEHEKTARLAAMIVAKLLEC